MIAALVFNIILTIVVGIIAVLMTVAWGVLGSVASSYEMGDCYMEGSSCVCPNTDYRSKLFFSSSTHCIIKMDFIQYMS